MEVKLSTGFEYLDNSVELSDQEKEKIKELTARVSQNEPEGIEFTYLDEHNEIILILEVENDDVTVVELNIDMEDID